VEHTIDVATTSFDPMAKLAKDIAAGAVGEQDWHTFAGRRARIDD